QAKFLLQFADALFLGLVVGVGRLAGPSLLVGLFALTVGVLALAVGLFLGAIGLLALVVGLFALAVGLLVGVGGEGLGLAAFLDLLADGLLRLLAGLFGLVALAPRLVALLGNEGVVAQLLARAEVPAAGAFVAQAEHQAQQGQVEAVAVVGLHLG